MRTKLLTLIAGLFVILAALAISGNKKQSTNSMVFLASENIAFAQNYCHNKINSVCMYDNSVQYHSELTTNPDPKEDE